MKVDGNIAKSATKTLAGKQTINTATTTTTTTATTAVASQGGAAVATGAGTRNSSTYPYTSTLVKKKSCTTLLCELTRLKTQQKYLECSQVKLNPSNYEDPSGANANNNNGATAFPMPTTGIDAMQLANEIECMKVQLQNDLKVYREHSFREVEDLRGAVSSLREDVQEPDRLSQFSLPMLRERIIMINAQLMQLCDKNQNEFEKLREECAKLESDNDVLVKV